MCDGTVINFGVNVMFQFVHLCSEVIHIMSRCDHRCDQHRVGGIMHSHEILCMRQQVNVHRRHHRVSPRTVLMTCGRLVDILGRKHHSALHFLSCCLQSRKCLVAIRCEQDDALLLRTAIGIVMMQCHHLLDVVHQTSHQTSVQFVFVVQIICLMSRVDAKYNMMGREMRMQQIGR